MTDTDAELRTLRVYGALCALHANWRGRLVVAAGTGAAISPIPTATSIAGGTSLVIEADPREVKAAHRRGAFDFVVATLDEALRTLKNEVRQGRPLAVGLLHDEAPALAEAAERGLLPDLCLLLPTTPDTVAAQLATLGAPLLTIDAEGRSGPLAGWLRAAGWAEQELSAEERTTARVTPAPDALRERWRQQAPLYLRSARGGITRTWH